MTGGQDLYVGVFVNIHHQRSERVSHRYAKLLGHEHLSAPSTLRWDSHYAASSSKHTISCPWQIMWALLQHSVISKSFCSP